MTLFPLPITPAGRGRPHHIAGAADLQLGLADSIKIHTPKKRSARHEGRVVTIALAFSLLVHFRETRGNTPTLRYTITAPSNTSSLTGVAISPDVRKVAMAATVNGKRQLWHRLLDELQAQPMAGTDDASYPFWSPDGSQIGFFAQGKLKKIAAGGGLVQSLCNAVAGQCGSWNRDNVIVFSPSYAGHTIQRVSAFGGVPMDVTKTAGTSVFPVFLPTGVTFCICRARGRRSTTACTRACWMAMGVNVFWQITQPFYLRPGVFCSFAKTPWWPSPSTQRAPRSTTRQSPSPRMFSPTDWRILRSPRRKQEH